MNTPGSDDSNLRCIEPWDQYNQALVSNVHPLDWVNPKPAEKYDLVVIGAGTAGLVTAAGAAGLGAKVALIERHLMGGDCLNVGCVPSKALIRAARAAADLRSANEFGLRSVPEIAVDFGRVMERMRRLRAEISPNDSANRFRKLGVDVFLGNASFAGPDAVRINGDKLRFLKAVIATGARAIVPNIPGLKDAGCLTNETIFSLTELPKRLLVIGAGPIGCEMAQAFRRFGSEVHLLEAADRILQREDIAASAIVQEALRRDGVQFLFRAKVLHAQKSEHGKLVLVELDGKKLELAVDQILVGAGRAPNAEGLSLEAAEVEYSARGVRVDEYLRTTNKRIFAAGDICLPFKFTHTADAAARIVIQNALFAGRKKWTSLVVPWCTYTSPELAHTGLDEAEAAERGIAVESFMEGLQHVDRAILDGESEGFLKILVRKGTDRIVGATLVAQHAGEMISEITLAITAGVGLRKMSQTIHCYPTQVEIIKRAADSYNRSRLTLRAKSVLGGWLAIRRKLSA